MAVWLKCGLEAIAFDDDVIPREALQRLLTLDALDAHAHEQRDSLMGDAESAATAMAAKARNDAAAVTRLGYAQGRRDALRHWHAEASAQRASAAARHGELRGRLADMVVQATARLVRGPVLDQYLHDALQALDSLAESEQTLTVSLHPDDCAVAQAAIDALQPRWPDGTVVKLVVSDALARGSCICESAQGYVDASLSGQLATLRQAALGALQDLQDLQDLQALHLPEPHPKDAVDTSTPIAPPPAQPSPDQRLSMPSYFPYSHEDDDADNEEDDGFDDDGSFEEEPSPAGPREPRW